MKKLTGDPRIDAAIIIDATIHGGERSTDLINMAAPFYRDQRDFALLREMTGGCLRRRMALEQIVRPHLAKGLDGTRPILREILLGHAYQMLFLDRIPAHARVFASVNAARRLDGAKGAGFVNAVARAVERSAGAEPARLLDKMPPEVLLSIPAPFMDVIRRTSRAESDSFDTTTLFRLALPSPTAVRIPRAPETRAEAIRAIEACETIAAPGQWAPDCMTLDSGRILSTEAVPRLVLPQDEASQLVVEALMPGLNDRIADLCCGTGIKTSQILSLAPGAEVVGIDSDTRKLDRCKELCMQSGFARPRVRGADVTSLPDEMNGCFDRVLLDAPCTGAGTLRRRPEVRYTRTRDDFTKAAILQNAMLERAVKLLAPGGRLVYAVCSFAKQEGLDVVKDVLARHPELTLVSTGLNPALEAPDLTVTTLPWIHDMDGFFISAMQRI